MCWFCYWGLPEAVAEVRDTYENSCNLDYGRAHVVWSDCNFETCSIESCLKSPYDPNDGSVDDDEDVKGSLEDLLLIPEEIRCPYFAYDDDGDPHNDPESHPPPSHIPMRSKR